MDRRTVLALVLVAAVIVVTPWILPRRSVPRTSPTPPTSLDTTTGRASSDVTPAPSLARPQRADSARIGTADSIVLEAVPETTVIRDNVAEYRFTNVGAAPLSTKMLRHPALNGHDSLVVLESGDGPLLRYRVVTERDTIPLILAQFRSVQDANGVDRQRVSYVGTVRGITARIDYTIASDSFLTRVNVSLGADSGAPQPRYLLVDLPRTLRSYEADSVQDHQSLAFAVQPWARGAVGVSFGSLDPGERRLESGPLRWAVTKSKYFLVGILAGAQDSSFAEASFTGGPRTSRTATVATATVVTALKNGQASFEVYAGPQEWRRLRALGREFDNSNPYGGFMQPVVQPFAVIVMRILLWMRETLSLTYGWVLVLFGVTVRIVLWPLNQSAMRASIKMQRIQPELSEIQKRYKDNPQKMQSEMMRVYKEHNMSPFSMFAGCLPMFLPLPVLFALFFVFQNTIEFRGVPFLWLSDISLKDPLYITPVLMGVSMFVMSWVGMRGVPPNPQAKIMAYVLPAMMTFFFLNFASGLNMYYAVQNIAAIPQQWLVARERVKTGSSKKK
jgi:YidC/Oxa1 family membrane protein insertase